MARELRTFIWCDRHQTEKDEQVEGVEYKVSLGRSGLLVMDLCDQCASPVAEVAELLSSYGRKADKAATEPAASQSTRRGRGGPHKCPMAGCDYPGGPSRGALDQHLRAHHDTTLAVMDGAPKVPCTMSGCSVELTGPSGWISHWKARHPDAARPPWPDPAGRTGS